MIRSLRLPLTAAQTAVWYGHQLDPSGRRYTVGQYLEVLGPLDRGLFEAAWAQLLQECQALQVHAVVQHGGIWQLLDPAGTAPPQFHDLTGHADPAAAARDWMRQDMQLRIELAGPLSWTAVLRVAPDRTYLYHRYHHIVTDAFGYTLILRRLAALYSALAAGEHPGPSPFHPLGALLGAETEYRGSDRFGADRAYWLNRLAGHPEPARLTRRGPRPLLPGDDPQRIRRSAVLPAGVPRLLRAAARARRTSWPVALAAVTAGYLHRMTGQREVLFALPVAARTDESARRTPGMVTNTVPLRLEVPAGASLDDLLVTTDLEVRAALEHQLYRHEDLARELGGALVGAMVNVMTIPAVRFAGHRIVAHNLSSGPAADLTVAVVDRVDGDDAWIAFDANPEYYDEADLDDHAQRFPAFLRAVAQRPDRPLEQVELLTGAERARLLAQAAGPDRPVGVTLLTDGFAAQAARTPDSVAVWSSGEVLSYAELDRRSGLLARRLAAAGVGPERLVALLMPRSAEAIVAMLAVVRAGGAYLPVDPQYPPDRIAGMLADARPACVIATIEARQALPAGLGVPVLDEADLAGWIAAPDPASPAPSPALSPDHPAYVIYTSGSTGVPKGVVVSHAGVTNLVADHVQRLGLGPDSRALQFVSPGFDAAVADIWPALLSGARLVLAPPGRLLAGTELAGFMRRHRITHAALPPVVVANLPLNGLDAEGLDLPDLAVLVVGGDTIEPDVVRRWSADRRMFNIYGPTEASVAATASDPLTGEGRPPIGRPIWNTRVFLLDAGLQLVPPGVTGELYLAGTGLARGYLGRPAETAERFLPCPSGPPGGRMYRTGDLARRRRDGELEFLGRLDTQVKVRGFRIELGEIEAVLTRQPDVAKAIVVARASGAARLVGYVLATPGTAPDPVALRAAAARQLPEFMVPAAVVLLDAFPLTPNGKVDRDALPAPDLSGGSLREPATGHERALCAVFAEVLGLAGFGPDESFFDHGGDSILALQVVSGARRAGLAVTIGELFRYPAPAALAQVAAPAAEPDRSTDPDAEGCGPVPPTPIAAWLAQRGGGTDGFNQSVLVATPAGADLGRLAAALQAVLDRHDALRMTLAGGVPVIRPAGSVDATELLCREDVTGHDPQAVDRRTAEVADAARDRLAPAAGRLVQAVWLDAGPDRPGRLLLTVHHLAVDGVSWRVLLPDLAAAWQGTPLEPVGTSMRGWARRLNEAAVTPDRERELAHWTGVLATPDPLLRTGIDRVPGDGGVRHLQVSLPAADAGPLLTRLPALFHARPDDVLLAGFALALRQWRRRHGTAAGDAVLLDLEGHGREDLGDGADLSRTVGWFTSLYPVRLDPGPIGWAQVEAGDAELGRALKQVKEQLHRVPARGLGYGLLRWLNPRTAPQLASAGTPRVALNYLGRLTGQGGDWAWLPDPRPAGGGLDPRMDLPHDLEVNALARDTPDGPQLDAVLSWRAGALDQADVEELAGLWWTALRGLARHARLPGAGGRTPSDLPLVELDQQQLERLESDHPGLLDVLPLTPLQQGLYLQTLLNGEGPDAYVAQLSLDLDGPLDAVALRAAGQALLARHPVLAAGFAFNDLPEPVQVPRQAVLLPWTEVDLREPAGTGPVATTDHPIWAQRTARADLLAQAQRALPFDPADPPLLRMLLIRLGRDLHRLVITNHHLLWDGWSTALLVKDLFALYARPTETTRTGTLTPIRDYLAWLGRQDRDAARRAWAGALAGFTRPTLVAPGAGDRPAVRHEQVLATLPAADSAALARALRLHGTTLATAVQAVWGLVLAQLTDAEDVVFGTSVSGRPAQLPGIERVVGMLTNTVPVRVRLDRDEPFPALLRRLQNEQAGLDGHQHLGLAEIQRLAGGRALFDTTTVCLNYPSGGDLLGLDGAGPRLVGMRAVDGTHFPLRLAAMPGRQLRLSIGYRPDVFTAADAGRFLARVRHLLDQLASGADTAVGRLEVLTPDEQQRLIADWGGYG